MSLSRLWTASVTPLERARPERRKDDAAEVLVHEPDQHDRHSILFIDHTAELGGGEIALLDLVSNLDKTRFHPVVLLFSNGPLVNRLEQAGIETHVIEMDERLVNTRKGTLGVSALLRIKDIWGMARYALHLARFTRSRSIHLVHTNSLKADIIGGLAARLARKPLLWHIRDRIEGDYLPRPAVLMMRVLCRVMPHCVVGNSDSTLETLRLPARKQSATVYSGLDLEAFDSAKQNAPQASTEGPVIGLIGRISPWKGQHVFLKAAFLVRQQFPRARFRIVGAALFQEHEYDREIRSLCAELRLEECVEFLGFRSDIPQVIAGLDLLVHASTCPEPFGQVVVQGMAGEKPVIATRGGGVTEIVIEGVTGLLVPMGDHAEMARSITQLLSDSDAARKMGARGRQRVEEHFTISQSARKMEHLYGRIIAVKGMRR